MPEYLAPGVYVEEIPSGNKPIQAASTSTAGMVGMTERGPVNTPTLVTSRGAYARLFGGDLNPFGYTGGRDALPYGAEGFFTNGGARLYVVRVVGPAATESSLQLVAEDTRIAASPALAQQARAGQLTMLVNDPGALSPGDTILFADGTASEMAAVSGRAYAVIGGGLDNGFAEGDEIHRQTLTAIAGTLLADLAADDTAIVLDDVVGLSENDILMLSDASDAPARHEFVTIQAIDGATGTITLTAPLAFDHAATSTLSSMADAAPPLALAGDVVASAGPVVLDTDAAGVSEGDAVRIENGDASVIELAVVTAVIAPGATPVRPEIGAGLRNGYPAGSDCVQQVAAAIAGALTAALEAGRTEIVLTDTNGLAADSVLVVRDASGEVANQEVVTIQAVDVPTSTITLTGPLARDHAAASTLELLTDDTPAGVLNAAVAASGAPVRLDVHDGAFAIDAFVRIAGGGAQEFAFVTALPEVVALAAPIGANHAAGTRTVPAVAVLTVHARWPGSWGDMLRVTSTPASLVQTQTTALVAADDDTITVATAFGLFPGSVIRFANGPSTEVLSVDASEGVVTLTQPIGVEIAEGTAVASQEFSLQVERLDNGRTAEEEVFDRLSLASEHPRYALKIIGGWDTGAGRPSESGASSLIRLSDDADGATRVMPLVHDVPRMLDGGTDDAANVGESSYVGESAQDPADRTGVQALENEPTISIVGVPGQTSLTVQKALVAHCEKMRFRFAVLDTPLGSPITAARSHRQNFDTTRAAIYYPGLEIADRFGETGDKRVIAPSGHVIGVYARTDLTRGVHKAPANEVLRGILSFETALTKGEQDILNPINLNCLRDFRTENRGLRVYGARVATSDPEWKYVNVRRLLLFIEQSLDSGLQWAVFEPNDQPLWDTVKQSITNFLTTVWRSGALEGTKQEEAFFVNIGYDITMSQDDIDNGRMIVEIGVAPVKPAEFVIVRISQKTREATS